MYKLKYSYITVVYIILISIISHIPGDNVSESTGNFPIQDELFHFMEFLVLGYLLQLSLTENFSLTKKEVMFSTIIIGFSIACLDEIHQGFVRGRHSSVGDMISDFTGILFSFLIYSFNFNYSSSP